MFFISDDIEKEYAGLVNDIESMKEFPINKHRERFLNGADPWVIALARNIGQCKVVSAEKKSLSNYGLGPVCDVLSVSHINLIQFFEENKIGLPA